MDNGQSARDNGAQPFFTTGAGSNFENKNDFEAEKNLNSDNAAAAWNVTPNRDPRSVGNTAIFSSEGIQGFPANQIQGPPANQIQGFPAAQTPEFPAGQPVVEAPETPLVQAPEAPGTHGEAPYERIENLQANPYVSSMEGFANQAPKLGEIVDLSNPGMPPGYDETPRAKTNAGEISAKIRDEDIKTTNTLSPQAEAEIERSLKELAADGDIAKFTNNIRRLNQLNVKNSFGVEF